MLPHQLEAIADHICDLVRALSENQPRSVPRRIALHDIHAAMRRQGLKVTVDDLRAAVAIAVDRGMLKAAGKPVHSVSLDRQ